MQSRVRYSKEFDEMFRYDEKDLGASCSQEGTIFKVWCPLADRVELHLYSLDNTKEYASYEMVQEKNGVWKWATTQVLHGTYYDYTVLRGKEVIRTADPYAVSCGCNGKRSMVVDLRLTDPEGFAEDKAPEAQAETIIYELHIKDFSYDPNSGVPEKYRGKYKAFTVSGTNGEYPTCMDHMKKLGITHVHLLPMYDFGWLDENGREEQYNWGYDPVNYNVPEGSYATDPHDGVVRIRECKEMIQALHQNGIRVIMDVVYNHTYEPDSWLERMVPGYYNRRWSDGQLSNGSACGSDMACGRVMVDNYIADSLMFWAKEYHIDGFRFDLMGLLTVELMNRIRQELDQEFGKGEKLLYGEPWRAAESPMEQDTLAALKCNIEQLDEGIAVFCDDTRDVIKGHVFYEEEPGFVNGGKGLEAKLLRAVSGWCGLGDIEITESVISCENGAADATDAACDSEERFRPKSCAQIINYVSAHDNFTLWDKLVLSMHGGYGVNNEYRQNMEPVTDTLVYTTKYEDVLKANKLAAFIYFTCQGHLFLQAGEEFGRTKYGDGNSYRSAPELNMLRWSQTQEFSDLLAYYEGLIRLRKKLPGLCDKSKEAATRFSERKIWKEGVVSFRVENSLREARGSAATRQENGCQSVAATSRSGEGQWNQLFVVYNGEATEAVITVPQGNWVVLADGSEADCCKEITLSDHRCLTIPAGSGMMLGRTVS